MDFVSQASFLFLTHEEMHLEFILEPERTPIIARSMDAGQTQRGRRIPQDHGKSERSIKRMLDRLHVTEEIRKMNNAGHVGFVKLDAAVQFEFGDHEEARMCASLWVKVDGNWFLRSRSISQGE